MRENYAQPAIIKVIALKSVLNAGMQAWDPTIQKVCVENVILLVTTWYGREKYQI